MGGGRRVHAAIDAWPVLLDRIDSRGVNLGVGVLTGRQQDQCEEQNSGRFHDDLTFLKKWLLFL